MKNWTQRGLWDWNSIKVNSSVLGTRGEHICFQEASKVVDGRHFLDKIGVIEK